MKRAGKSLVFLLLAFVLLVPFGQSALAAVPYESYVYDHNSHPVPIPLSYVPVDAWDGISSGSGAWNTPGDIKVGDDGTVYVADTGNDRIVVLSPEGKQLAVWGQPDNTDKDQVGSPVHLKSPQGLYLDRQNHLYVADTGNQRIVKLDMTGRAVRIFEQPVSNLLPSNFQYQPMRLAVDERGEMFVVSKGLYEGMLELADDGSFVGFFGANRVPFDLNQFLLKLISTKEQKEQMKRKLPSEFSSVAIDSEGFLYSTTLRLDFNQVKKISSVGVDVLNANGQMNKYGDKLDIFQGVTKVLPQLVGIAVDDMGIITVMDGSTSRLFQYDQNKQLLSVFGGKGSMLGLIDSAASLDVSRDSSWVYALDSGLGRLTRYRATEFTQLLHKAITLYNDGKYTESKAPLQHVLDIDRNYELANIGIAKSMLKEDQYASAAEYSIRGYDKSGYSRAFQYIRVDWLREHFSGFLLVMIALYLSIWYVPWMKRRLAGAGGIGYSAGNRAMPFLSRLGVIFRPLSGFDRFHAKEWKPSYIQMGIIVALACLVRIGEVEWTGFSLNKVDPEQTSILFVTLLVLVPWFSWCLVNYGLSTLLDGEGSAKQVFATSVYCLLPYVLLQPLLILLSRVLTAEEAYIYNAINMLIWLWVGLLFIFHTMVIHQYTFKRTIAIVLLTLAGMFIIWFLGTILYTMINQVIGFIFGIYREIIFRR